MSAVEARGVLRAQRHLLPSERVVVAVRRHWASVAEPVAVTVAAFVGIAWLDVTLPRELPGVRDLLWLGWIVLALRLGWKVLEWRLDWFVATDKRLLLTHGLLTRKVAMMPMTKVTDLSYNRSPAGRLLGYGEFVLESAGQDQALRTVGYLPRPDDLYLEICTEIFGPDSPAAKRLRGMKVQRSDD